MVVEMPLSCALWKKAPPKMENDVNESPTRMLNRRRVPTLLLVKMPKFIIRLIAIQPGRNTISKAM